MSPAIDAVRIANGRVYWIEGRQQGDVLVCWSAGEGCRDVLPPGVEARSSVHEYGGGAYLPHGGEVLFVRGADQRICRTTVEGVVPVTPLPDRGEDRHGDLCVSEAGLVFCVRERHRRGRVVNELVSVPADGSAAPRVVAEGWDFYSSPRINRDGSRLAWVTWRKPLMPWDGSWLWVADLGADGTLGGHSLMAGGPQESVCQPAWGPDGDLYFLSDRAGWWNLYRHRPGRPDPVIAIEAELTPAPWEFGYSTYCLLEDGRIAVVLHEGFRQRVGIWDPRTVHVEPTKLAYTSIKPYLATDAGRIVLIGFTLTHGPTVVLLDPDRKDLQELNSPPSQARSTRAHGAEATRFSTRDGAYAHFLLHAPERFPAMPDQAPWPLLVRVHPGPTANIQLRFDPWIRFFTGHGFAVLEVDYRGSTGYGRAYRNALRHRWGVLDVSDCVDAVDHLVRAGRIDAGRVGICGASAGGYTALRAVATTATFKAAAVRHAIIDPASWRNAAPKFQSHHADLLIGRRSEASTYAERSLFSDPRAITVPVLLVHGEKDAVSPVSDVRRLADSLGGHATLLTFPDEGHGIRHPEHERSVLDAELAHFQLAFDG